MKVKFDSENNNAVMVDAAGRAFHAEQAGVYECYFLLFVVADRTPLKYAGYRRAFSAWWFYDQDKNNRKIKGLDSAWEYAVSVLDLEQISSNGYRVMDTEELHELRQNRLYNLDRGRTVLKTDGMRPNMTYGPSNPYFGNGKRYADLTAEERQDFAKRFYWR